jgi:hypothetical protein
VCDSVTSVQQNIFLKISPHILHPNTGKMWWIQEQGVPGKALAGPAGRQENTKCRKSGVLRGGGCGSILREI